MHCHQKFATRADAKHAVIDYIERCYNRFRPHSTIDGQIPAKKMASSFERTARAVELDVGNVENWQLSVRNIETAQSPV